MSSKPTIFVLYATIRPYVFIQTYSIWRKKAQNNENIKFLIAVNSKQDSDIIQQFLYKQDKIIIVNTDKRGVCYPSYELSSKLEGDKEDIVIFASDDFYPPDNYDTYLINKLNNKEGGLMVRDGYQLPDSSNMLTPVMSIPILTYGCLERLNKIIYHPAYNHMHSDGELYKNLKELNLLIDDRITDATAH